MSASPTEILWEHRHDSGVNLWLIDLDAHASRPDASILSRDERARAMRFVFERDRLRFMAARCALRQLLAQAVGAHPSSLHFDIGPQGKPALAGLHSCQFNLSHSQGYALVGITEAPTEIGVDVEQRKPMSDARDVAARLFTATELAELDRAATPEASLEVFFRCWTRKEAVLKALGLGFQLDPASFEAGSDASSRTVQVASLATTVEVHSLELPIETLTASLALCRHQPMTGVNAC